MMRKTSREYRLGEAIALANKLNEPRVSAHINHVRVRARRAKAISSAPRSKRMPAHRRLGDTAVHHHCVGCRRKCRFSRVSKSRGGIFYRVPPGRFLDLGNRWGISHPLKRSHVSPSGA
jgi:hypothetical protein